jgi:hypothetical protein
LDFRRPSGGFAETRTVADDRQGRQHIFASPFYSRIAQVYGEGAGIVLAADLEKIIAHTRGVRRLAVGDQRETALSQLGVFNMKSFVSIRKTRWARLIPAQCSLTRRPTRSHFMVSTAAPMGSLEYISPDANLVAGS